MMTLVLLLSNPNPGYASFKDTINNIADKVSDYTSKACKYVKKHKWPFIAGTIVTVGGICYSNEQKRKQDEEDRKNNPFNDNDNDGYPNGEEGREGSDPNDPNSEPQDDAWKELSINSFNPVRTAMPSKLETALSNEPIISGPIVPVYLNLGKNSSICGEFGKENARLYFNYKF